MTPGSSITEPESPGAPACRVLVAPDSMGGWLGATEFCDRIQQVLDGTALQLCLHPLADGGEGSLEVLRYHLGCLTRTHRTPGPLGRPRQVESGLFEEGVFIESAQAVGLPDGHGTGQPMASSSRGLGAWIRAEQKASKLTIGLGGSATVDGGIGMLRELGFGILDRQGRPVPEGAHGLILAAKIRGESCRLPPLEAWCDVRTPISGCVTRYGPQKGLPDVRVGEVHRAMKRWADLLEKFARDRGGPLLDADVEGGGAAGGIGLALHAALGAELKSGAESFIDQTRLERSLEGVDWVIVVEGQMDEGSFDGKLMGSVIRRARVSGVPVVAMVGRALSCPDPPLGPDQVLEIGEHPSRDSALERNLRALSSHFAGWSFQ